MRPEKAPSAKDEIRKMRIAEARSAVARAEKYIGNYPSTHATPLVNDLRRVMRDLLAEVMAL